MSGTTKIVVYFDGFLNDSNNYVSFSVSEIIVNELMSFKELYNILISKLGNYIDMYNIVIYLFLGPIKWLKKDLAITNNNDVKWVYHTRTCNVEQHIMLIVHSVAF